jgi:hypothetical protein
MRDDDERVREALRRATEADDRETLWANLEPLRDRLAMDVDVARVWAEALRTSPARRTLLDEARVILERWPGDPMLVGAVCDALVRAGERRPIDEPPLEEGAAGLAASAADRAFAKLSEEERRDPDVGGRLLALRANALRLLGPRRYEEAVATLGRALALDPNRGEWHYDLALTHKHARDFALSLEASRRARAMLGDVRPLLWNLAIAATALGRGEEAAEAWRALGVPAEAQRGQLPFVAGLEPVQVRLPTVGPGHTLASVVPDDAATFEVVWAQPLSPCHGVIRTPTFRDAIADFGDVVLWDGAPVLVVEHEGARVPRFPLLRVLKKGDERRFRFLALQQRPTDVVALARELPEGVVLYPHGERVERLCPRCAAGETLIKHEHLPPEEHRVAFGKIVVPGELDLGAFARSLEEARRKTPGVLLAIPSLYEALGETKQAGMHHKRWGEIERTATRPR